MSKVIKNISYLGVLQIANYLLPIIYIPFVSRIIGPEGYGSINFSYILVSYFTALIAFGFDYSATRIVAVDPNNKNIVNKTFSNVFYAQIFLFIIAVIVFILLINVFPSFNKDPLINFYTFLLCIASLFTQNWMFQAKQDLSRVAILNFLSKLLITIIIIVYVEKKEDYHVIPLISSIVMIAIGIVSFILSIRLYKIKFVTPQLKSISNTIKESFNIYLTQLTTTFYNSINVIIMGLYSTSIVVGFYTAGQKLITLEHILVSFPVNIAFYPVFSKKIAVNKLDAMLYIQKIYPFFMIMFFFLAIFNFLCSPYLINIFYGDSFMDSVIIMQILCLLPFFSFSNNFIGVNVLFNLKKDKSYLLITLFSGVLGIFINLIFAESLSFKSAAIAWLTSEVCCFIFVIYLLNKNKFYVFNLRYIHPISIVNNLKSLSK